MNPQISPIPLLGMLADWKHSLLQGLVAAFWFAWNAVGWAFLTALVVFSLTYGLLWRRSRRHGLVTEAEEQDLNEIAGVAGVGAALIVQARQYLWAHLGLATIALVVALALGFGLLIAWAQRRDGRLGRSRSWCSRGRAKAGATYEPSPTPPRRI
jgi:hypothetical protein